MADRQPSDARELVPAATFTLGCVGQWAFVLWLGPEGFALGFATYAFGAVLAMEIEDRWRRPRGGDEHKPDR